MDVRSWRSCSRYSRALVDVLGAVVDAADRESRQLEALQLRQAGRTYAEIAEQVGLSVHTVKRLL